MSAVAIETPANGTNEHTLFFTGTCVPDSTIISLMDAAIEEIKSPTMACEVRNAGPILIIHSSDVQREINYLKFFLNKRNYTLTLVKNNSFRIKHRVG